jgi:hypothetical protein
MDPGTLAALQDVVNLVQRRNVATHDKDCHAR